MDHIPTATRSPTAGDVMDKRFATASPESSLAEIRTKLGKAPAVAVLDGNGVLLGLIGLANLPDAAPTAAQAHVPTQLGAVADLIMSFIGHAAPEASAPEASAPDASTHAPTTQAKAAAGVAMPMTAEGLRSLVATFEQRHADEERAIVTAAEAGRMEQVKMMRAAHVEAQLWDGLMTKARLAAEHGAHEFELLRFPAGLCSDGARKINNAEHDWPETLSGEAAEVYARWDRELRQGGFGVAARVLDYPHGLPGDVSLVLTWQH